MNARDMTKAEFDAACRRYGFKPQNYMGYYELPSAGHLRLVSVWNAGKRRRDQLAYLLREDAKRTAP